MILIIINLCISIAIQVLSIVFSRFSFFRAGTLNAEPLVVFERKTPSVPVNSSTLRANVHFFERLDLAPAEFTMRDEFFVSLDFLQRRNVFVSDHFSIFCGDEKYLLSAEGTVRVISPPLHDTVQTEDMSTCEFSIAFRKVPQANDTFFLC